MVKLEKARRTSAPSLSEVGLTGLQRDESYVLEEWLPPLQGEKQFKVYREMRDNDSVVGSVMFAIDMVMRQAPWDIEPFDNSNEAKQGQQFALECKDDMSHTWEDFISECLSFIPFGFSYFNIVYKRRNGVDPLNPGKGSKFDDGRYGWRKFSQRAQDTKTRWKFDEKGGVEGMYQSAPPDYTEVFIPISRALLFRPSSYKNNPEGRSALRNAYRPWYFKKRVEEIEGIGIERDLAGIPVAYVDPKIMSANASDEEKAFLESIKQVVTNLRRDQQEGIVMPRSYDPNGHPLYEITLLGSGGNRQYDTTAIINRYDQRIAMTLLADFIMLGHDKTGSFALASSRTTLFARAIGAWLDSIQETLNRHAIPKLFAVNGMDLEKLPRFTHGDIATPDLEELANFITRLAAAGVPLFPDDKLEEHLRRQARLPAKPLPGEDQPRTLMEHQAEVGASAMRQLQGGGMGALQRSRSFDLTRAPRPNSPAIPRGTPDDRSKTQRGI